MATLKNLVDETTNIKNELVICRTNLKNNLSNKGVSVSSSDKLNTLINKVANIQALPNATSNQHITYKVKEIALSLGTDYKTIVNTLYEIKGDILYLCIEDKYAKGSDTYFRTVLYKYNLNTKKLEYSSVLSDTSDIYSNLYGVCFLDNSILVLNQTLGISQYSLNDLALIKKIPFSYYDKCYIHRLGNSLYILSAGSSLSRKNSTVSKLDLTTLEVVKTYTFYAYSDNSDYYMYTPRFITSDESGKYIYACAGYGMQGMNRIVKLDLNLTVLSTSNDNITAYEYTCIKNNKLITADGYFHIRCYDLSNNSLVGEYQIYSNDGSTAISSELNGVGVVDSSRNYIYLKKGGYAVRISISNYKIYEEIYIPYDVCAFNVDGDTISCCTNKRYAQYKIKSI